MTKNTLYIIIVSLIGVFMIWGISMCFTQKQTTRWSDATKDSLGNNKIALEHIKQLQQDNAYLVKVVTDCKQIINLYSEKDRRQQEIIDSLSIKLEQCRHGIEIRQ